MTPDKEIMDFVYAERLPAGGVTLLIDGNRRKEAAIQRWVMDVTRHYPAATTEFVTLSELNRRREVAVADNRPVDIYLVGDSSDEGIRTWAIKHNIPVDKVRSRQITLNHDGGLWMRYGQGQMPVILQQGENGWQLAAF